MGDNGNGSKGQRDDYESLLTELKEKGVLANGDEIASNGMQLLQAQPGKPTALSMIASVPAAHEVYAKDKVMALLTDLIARTHFFNHKERIAFLDYIDWCVEFQVPLDNAIRYVASARSEGGQSISQLIDAMTTFNHRQYNYGGKDKNKIREKSGKGAFS